MPYYYDKLNHLLAEGIPFVSVTLVDAHGSIPNELGAKILVTEDGLHYGTIGGGKLELKTLALARQFLMAPQMEKRTHFVEWDLKRDVGMTCGGGVKLYFEVHNHTPWRIVVFGAGHVANALISILVKLNCQITCIDPRSEWLEKLPRSSRLTPIQSDHMPGEVALLPEDAFVLLLTMGHAYDLPILLEILKTRQFPYLGVMGSKAKAARLKKDIREAGLPEACQTAYFCPIGLNFGTNHPQEIALSIVAQLLQERDCLRAGSAMATGPLMTSSPV